ncbi:MAG: tRNA dihydrouridine synthase DusB [Eubacterium coprostanoligenes]|uniref:tRNA dihydrouridine synthase DusB n=1 Tax=Eubacterium coprostanoligenes TaxID=290054 RepID=UPI0023F26A48|nr:tRNA dihydrouridine synthase DusB [Eubacterium coprostanoligenes]MDD7357362.1 tRNA dihydrouridine synthase DusB [Eubacterium coprostanoligenes]
MKIGDLEFTNIAFLAPMAGIADRAFRELCTQFGAAYTVTEMVSSKGLTMGDKKSGELLTIGNEHPCGAQIFGDDPEIMAQAAVKCLEYNPNIIDINMGCPAPKVAMNGGGASLMKKPQLAYEITKAVVEAVDIPVTVKIRKGWDDDNINAVEMALLAQKAGASAVAVHGRTRQQMYSGTVDYDIIAEVKNALDIPVIANGDITDEQTAAIMLEKTNADAIMIGRGALGNPWVFSRINAYISECRVLPEPSTIEKMNVMLKHIQKIIEYKGEYTAMREARHHASYYTKGMRGGAKLRAEISKYEHFEQLQELSYRIIKEAEL